MLNNDQIAEIAHNVNKAYCEAAGDMSQPTWADQTPELKAAAIEGVELHLKNPNVSAEESHNAWMAEKTEAGWKFGDSKDPTAKEHPAMVPWAELDVAIKSKDYIFKAVVDSLTPYAESAPAPTEAPDPTEAPEPTEAPTTAPDATEAPEPNEAPAA